MKKIVIVVMLAVGGMLASCHKSGDLQIRVKDSDDYYRFAATYDEAKTPRINEFINREIAPTHIESTEDIDVETILNDDTRFKWESSPGELLIYLDKGQNSKASYHRIRNMCERIKHLVGEKQ